MGLNPVAQKQELRPEGLSTFPRANPSLKEVLEKFELDVKTANFPEGKFSKLPLPLVSGII